jgi:hypothetical protein
VGEVGCAGPRTLRYFEKKLAFLSGVFQLSTPTQSSLSLNPIYSVLIFSQKPDRTVHLSKLSPALLTASVALSML